MSTEARLSVVVVEDEFAARAGLIRLVADDPELACVASAGDVETAVQEIVTHQAKIVLLDVRLTDGTGFDVLQAVGTDASPLVVFVTAYDQFAIRAFEACALDYLVKPFDDDRFARAMARAKAACRDAEATRLGRNLLRARSTAPPLTRLAIKAGGRVLFIPVRDIDWIEADDYYARIHVLRKSYLLRESLTNLQEKLDPALFFRTHRSAIVNVERVTELQPSARGEHGLVLRDGARVPLTRARREDLEALLRRGPAASMVPPSFDRPRST